MSVGIGLGTSQVVIEMRDNHFDACLLAKSQ